MKDEKLAEKEKLDADIAKFLANGGEIKKEPIRVVKDLKEMAAEGKRRFNCPIQNDPR